MKWISDTLNSEISYQDNKADVILKYNADEARSLKAYGELPEHGEYIGRNVTATRQFLMKRGSWLAICWSLCCAVLNVMSLNSHFWCLAAKINETDTFGPGDDDEIQFDDIGDDDEDIDDVSTEAVLYSSED